MAKKIKRLSGVIDTIDCACVIHDTAYDWQYVERLYRGLCRHLTPTVNLHVYTEASRTVPAPYIHHPLTEWQGIRGPKSSWWYKIQLFNPEQFVGNLLYFDLDTVIVNNIDWIWQSPPGYFYAPRDFKYLFRPKSATINSSVMWFNTQQFAGVYQNFLPQNLLNRQISFRGDQEYIHSVIPEHKLRYLDNTRIQSYKWQLREGGFDFKTRRSKTPGSHTVTDGVSVLIFHGNPKPHEVADPVITQNWI